MQGSFFKDPATAGALTAGDLQPAGDFHADLPAQDWRAAGTFMGQEAVP